jgi:hypothetical protein
VGGESHELRGSWLDHGALPELVRTVLDAIDLRLGRTGAIRKRFECPAQPGEIGGGGEVDLVITAGAEAARPVASIVLSTPPVARWSHRW